MVDQTDLIDLWGDYHEASQLNRAPPNSQILRLSSKIRELIFGYVIPVDNRYRRLGSLDSKELLSGPIPSSAVNLLLICHDLKEDAELCFYEKGYFILDGRDTREFGRSFTSTALENITRLQISYSKDDRHEPLPYTYEEVNTVPSMLPDYYGFFLGLSQDRFPSTDESDLKLFRAWDIKSSIICGLPAIKMLAVDLSACTYTKCRSGTEWVICRLVILHTVRLLESTMRYPAMKVTISGVAWSEFKVLQRAMLKYGSGGIKLSYGQS